MTVWMDLEGIMLSEISQADMWNFKKLQLIGTVELWLGRRKWGEVGQRLQTPVIR